MAGAIAGTAISNIGGVSDKLHTVTLTVNDSCNLDCGYCYLREDSKGAFVSEEVIRMIEASDFEHLAVVGKEPLINKGDADRTLRILERIGRKGISGSIITNGIGLRHVREIPENLRYIDISFDGGAETFKARHSVEYWAMAREIERLVSLGVQVNALQTIHGGNIDQIDLMMQVREIDGIKTIMFSPYLVTRNYGADSVSRVDLAKLIGAFAESASFRDDETSLVLIDGFHVKQDELRFSQMREEVERRGLEDKVMIIEENPLLYGIIRVTYDGKILTPAQSLHVRDYALLSRPLPKIPLEKVYEKMVA